MDSSEPPFLRTYSTLFEDSTQKSVHKNKPLVAADYELPLIDLSCLSLGEADRRQCEGEIADAASQLGFFQVVNHGVSPDVLARMHHEQVDLFRQPFSEKADERLMNLPVGCYRWGNPNATSLMQFSWSEAFHIPLSNISGLRDFDTIRSPTEEFVEVVSDLAQRIAEVLADNLGCKSDFFAENCLPSSCYFRMNRYPPCPVAPQAHGLVPHTDSDFLTILCQDQLGGLQLVKDGSWVSVKPNPDALVVNIGDLFQTWKPMMQAWSNGVYKSIEHRVMTNQKFERFSVAYFFCPSYDTVIQGCGEPSLYREFSFEEYREQVQQDVESTGSKVGLPRFLA
ncbi:hypothetical protein RJ639_047274 [Escallonia herrerae]|uniref:Fe2OG dioxygenase domain-containing protein n=1 Tax=Escallonia herrerae TaxID=1293975 RepID=A0AA89AZZ8_9ASTE|nr:hypothetical protein RJ639_047274 [Escallonia herrerae]